ncbi:MAG: sigma-70 family RNA polymerase sigma factor [Acholeplasmataceae bacterium]|nr:sigma-70 family RNA polymerase sigma factor [Acholeplasmataceae bacterium]
MKLEKEPTIFDLEIIEEELSNSNDPINLSDSLRIYLKDIGQVKLLTREEEIELATAVSMARDSTDDKVIELGKEARDKLIVANLRLVVSVAKKYTYSNVPFMDLIQDGTMGLMRAVDGYQVEKGFKFSTYATWWIIQSISRSISNNSRTIRIPVHVYDTLSKVRRVKRSYVNEHGIEPGIETVAKITGISIVTLKMIKLYIDDIISLDNPIGDGDFTFNDFTEDTNNPNPEEYNKIKELEEYVAEILQELDEREQTIINMRFGFESEEKTLEEIGKILCITKERVRQIESRAIKKLRKIITT